MTSIYIDNYVLSIFTVTVTYKALQGLDPVYLSYLPIF